MSHPMYIYTANTTLLRARLIYLYPLQGAYTWISQWAGVFSSYHFHPHLFTRKGSTSQQMVIQLEFLEQFFRSKAQESLLTPFFLLPCSQSIAKCCQFFLYICMCISFSLSLLLSRSLITVLHSSDFDSVSILFIFHIEDRMIFQK